MNSLDRAKQFLAAKASKLALVAVPLAALTVAAPTSVNAAPLSPAVSVGFTLNPSSSCSVYQTGTCTLSVSSKGGNPSGNEVTLYTNGAASGDSTGNLEIVANGSGSGSIGAGAEIPISYDFLLTNPGALSDTATGYLELVLNPVGPGSGGLFLIPFNSIAVGNEYQGTGTFTLPVSFSLGSYYEDLHLTSDTGSQLIVSVPSGTGIELNAAVATPEPASLFLAGTGILGALALKRRKKS